MIPYLILFHPVHMIILFKSYHSEYYLFTAPSKEFQNITLAPAKTGEDVFRGVRMANRRRQEPEQGRGARVTGSQGEAGRGTLSQPRCSVGGRKITVGVNGRIV